MYYLDDPIGTLKISIEDFRSKTKSYYPDCTKVYMFPQAWGSTALGFRDLGGQAVTVAHTIVIIDSLYSAYVYFNGRFAYQVNYGQSEIFRQDLSEMQMAPVYESAKYKE
jgi:hypothetical protein